MAKLTFVIQASISDIPAHMRLQDILKEINASAEHQVERLVFMGPAAVLAANEDLAGNLLLNLGGRHYPFVSSAPYAEEEEEEERHNKASIVSSFGAEKGSVKDAAAEEDEDEFDDFELEDEDDLDDDDDYEFEEDDFTAYQAFLSLMKSIPAEDMMPLMEALQRDKLPSFMQRQKLINQTGLVFNTLLEDYHKIILLSNCEVMVHDVAAKHYQLTPQTIHPDWSFVDTKGLLDIMQAESMSSKEGDDQHLVFVWSGLGNEAESLDALMEAYAEKKAANKSQVQPDSALSQHKDSLKSGHKKHAPKASALLPQESSHPELVVFFDFPRVSVDILSSSLAAPDDYVRNDLEQSCTNETWWRVAYGLSLIQEMRRAKFRVKVCMSVDIREEFADEVLDLSDLNMPAVVSKLLVKTANKGVPFYYLNNGYTSFVSAMKHEVIGLMMTKASVDMLELIDADYEPLMFF